MRRLALVGTLGVAGFLASISSVGGAPLGEVTEFTDGLTQSGFANGIAAGPDGNLWFTEFFANQIGRITIDGMITEFPIPTADTQPRDIAAGPDGNLWFTEADGAIGRITPGGVIDEFPVPSCNVFCDPYDITAGPDGNLWFTLRGNDSIGRVTPSGAFDQFPIPYPECDDPDDCAPLGITSGVDGRLWFVIVPDAGAAIGSVDTAGNFAPPFPVPSGDASDLTTGFDGNLWFTEFDATQIGRMTLGGDFTEFPIPGNEMRPSSIARGVNGELWFTNNGASVISRITATGEITSFPLPTEADFNEGPGVTAGPDCQVWFTTNDGQEFSAIDRVGTGVQGANGECFTTETIDAVAIRRAPNFTG